MARTKLRDRRLPSYTKGEEIFNMVSHIVGGALGITVTTLCVIFAALHGNVYGVVGGAIYGGTMILLYTMSSIYHGLRPDTTGKKVFQIIDHCSIFLLIAGTYTPISLAFVRDGKVAWGWVIFGIIWGAAALGITLNAIDLKSYKVFSMICYLAMGWCIVMCAKQAYEVLGFGGTLFILLGGVAYTIGAILYGVGKKHKYFHSIFHLFIVAGSILQFFGILFYLM